MNRSTLLKEDLEMEQLREAEQELLLRQQEFLQIPKKLAQEQYERACTMPPLAEIEERRRRNEHDQLVSRGQMSNIQRDQSRSFLLLMLLLTATATLIWWGVMLMNR